MSHPTAISPEDQEQIARQIGVLLLQGAPEDWQQITVEYRATGEYHDLLAETVRQDGSTSDPWDPPEELLGIFEHLREGMYRPDVGTWLSALYIVERPSSYRIDINFDEEPQWQQPLPRAAYVDELRRYPRSEDNVPDWMHDRLDGSAGASAPHQRPDRAPAPDAPGEPEEDGTGPLPRATGSSHFRTARVFDDADEQGRPLITTRMPIPPEDSAALRQYLENAPVVLTAQDNEPDQLDPSQPAVVPGTWHTDGVWLWQGAVAYYLAQYGVPPESELVEHARARRFGLTRIDEGTRDAAVGVLMAPSGVDDLGDADVRDHAFGSTGSLAVEHGERSAGAPTTEDSDLDGPHEDDPATGLPDAVTTSGGGESLVEEPAPSGVDVFGAVSDQDRDRRSVGDEQPVVADPDAADTGEYPDDSMPVADLTATVTPVDAPETRRPEEDGAGPVPDDTAPADPVPPEPAGLDTPDAVLAGDPLPEPGDGVADTPGDADPVVTDASAATPGPARHGRSDGDDEIDSADSDVIFDELRERLDNYGMDRDGYLIGEHVESLWSLHDEGSDWVVTGPQATQREVRFERPEQAAAYLLGSVLMAQDPQAGTAPEPTSPVPAEHPVAATSPERGFAAHTDPERVEPAGDLDESESAVEDPDAGPVETRVDDQGEQGGPAEQAELVEQQRESPGLADLPRRAPERAQQSPGGNFLFTANQTPPPENAEPAGADPALGGNGSVFTGSGTAFTRDGTAFTGNGTGTGEHTHAGRDQEPPVSPATPPPIGQPVQAPPPAAPGSNGAPPAGQVPPPLPKRPPRAEHGGAAAHPPQAANRPPAPPQQPRGQQPQGPQTPPGNPDQRHNAPHVPGGPAPGGPAQQGLPQHGPGPAPIRPQQAPGQQPAPGGQAPPNPGQEQPIQPLNGEPPLTLFRDRRTIMLQPGTEVDRFGDPNGNVTYAAHTPYNQRSLPPQWANRTFLAYRVQRPVQVLRGTAVPWFEQPGGGTAYVLPLAVGDLLADGTLVALNGTETPQRPPME